MEPGTVNPVLILENTGFGCMHPNERDLYLEAFYSERGKLEELDSRLKVTGEQFINSFRFEEVSR